NVREQFALHRKLPTRGIGVARVRIVEPDGLAEGGGQAEARPRGLLDTVREWIGKRGRLGQIAIVGGDQWCGLAKPGCVVAGDPVRKVVNAGSATQDRFA